MPLLRHLSEPETRMVAIESAKAKVQAWYDKEVNPIDVAGSRENLQISKKRKEPPQYNLSERPTPGGSMDEVLLIGNALVSTTAKEVPRDAGSEKEVPAAMVDQKLDGSINGVP